MKCIVTGAAGFIGSSLCERLLNQEFDVIGIDFFVNYYPKILKPKLSDFKYFMNSITGILLVFPLITGKDACDTEDHPLNDFSYTFKM